jgi:ABC-type antimicrobial peptide transport system permease subunit
MFLTYLWRELRRRMRQAIFISLGLALGVGLVITVTAASSGVKDAQTTVLHSLYGIGTDVTVTKAAPKGTGGASSFSIGGGKPSAGQNFDKNMLLSASGGLGTISSSDVAGISQLSHVSNAAGALALTDLDVSGKIPAVTRSNPNPGKTSFSTSSFSVLGSDTSARGIGPLASSKLTAGRMLTAADANSNVALLDANYAAQNKLKPGSKITIGNSNAVGTSFKVIGVVQAPPGAAAPAEVYIPLARAQHFGASPRDGESMSNKVNTIYVSATSAADIGSVQQEISKLLPTATVTTSSDLANEVSGSLSSTASLANNLGKWLAVAVLIAAFMLASLLTMAAVARRVREFGTLKALGWRSRRIVGQVMGEAMVIGIIGGAVGVAIGFAGAELVTKLAPPLSATVGQTGGGSGPGGAAVAKVLSSIRHNAVHTVSVHLTAPVTVDAVVLAVVLAVSGGLLSGALGGWRAARLRPAAALARLE